MNDLKIKCIDCGNDFIFSEGEQVYYKEKGLFTPKRCSFCRKAKKKEKMFPQSEDKRTRPYFLKRKHNEKP